MNEGFSPFSAMAWTISITGWWKCLLQATPKPSANILTLLQRCITKRAMKNNHCVFVDLRPAMFAAALLCVFALAPAAHSQTPPAKKTAPPSTAAKPAVKKPVTAAPSSAKTEEQLSTLALALRDKPTAAAEQRLIDFAQLHAKDEFGSWAALALGHYFLDRNHPPDALKWFAAALHHPSRLDEYAMFWHAQTLRQLGHNDEALPELAAFRQRFPGSVMTDLAVQSYAEGAIAQGDAQSAAKMLDACADTAQKPVLLLLRAQAREKSSSSIAAAKDYITIYYDFPLSDEARAASQRIPALGRELGDAFPGVPLAQQTARAEALFTAHRWSDAHQEFEATLPQTAGADHDHAELRIAQIRSSQGGAASALASAKFSDPAAESERLYSLSQAYRNEKHESEMLAAITEEAARFPQGQWTAEALFATGNYYWVLLNRPLAAEYYRHSADAFPAGKNTSNAMWRATWASYMVRKPESVSLLESYIKSFPTSTSVPDALYWLGRAAERDGNVPRARSFYVKGQQRFPQTFFGLRAADRIAELGTQPLEPAGILSAIPDAPPLGALDAPIPAEAQDRWQRTIALRAIGFDSSAELELRAAYAATQSPRLLLEAAQSAVAAEHYAVAIALARQAYPQPEARKITEMPPAVAKALYPLPFFSSVTSAAVREHVDPMIVAGVMRQESAFQPEVVSIAGAVGLMQLLPRTAPSLARRLKLKYSRVKLFDPVYNVQLGTLYLSDLIGQFGGPEGALAAYNAGEDRSKLWRGERNYSEAAEFVESIPFTQTHDYVQIVMRNAEIYHILNPAPPATATTAKQAATNATPAKSTPAKSPDAKSKTRGAS
jgi:soluble lytic murein transglycosylase